jgi:hypothetical protein
MADVGFHTLRRPAAVAWLESGTVPATSQGDSRPESCRRMCPRGDLNPHAH